MGVELALDVAWVSGCSGQRTFGSGGTRKDVPLSSDKLGICGCRRGRSRAGWLALVVALVVGYGGGVVWCGVVWCGLVWCGGLFTNNRTTPVNIVQL